MERAALLALTVMLSGRAMTLAFIHRAGGLAPGDPPAAWLMPLVGDAVIGLAGLAMAAVIARGRGLWAWTSLVVWNALGLWDALAAFLVSVATPWPEFFMYRALGPSMFFAAAAMHGAGLALLGRRTLRQQLTERPGEA